MNERQKKFCEIYTSNGGNALEAYKQAGYALIPRETEKHCVERMLGNNSIRERIEGIIKEAREMKAKEGDEAFIADIMKRNERLARLSAIARQEAYDEVVIKGKVVKRKCTVATSIKAMELMARIEGDLADKREVQDDVVITVGMEKNGEEEEEEGEILDAEYEGSDKRENN